jgi:hypothetical protein
MIPRLLIALLELWGLGSFILVVLAFCRLLFSQQFRPFLGRVMLASIWPLALLSRAGRQNLVEFYKAKEGE